MSQPTKAVRQPDQRMLVQLTVEELRSLIAETVEDRLKRRLPNGNLNGLLNAEESAAFLGFSKDWVYRNWRKIGGRKIGGKGLRFDAAELAQWSESRRG